MAGGSCAEASGLGTAPGTSLPRRVSKLWQFSGLRLSTVPQGGLRSPTSVHVRPRRVGVPCLLWRPTWLHEVALCLLLSDRQACGEVTAVRADARGPAPLGGRFVVRGAPSAVQWATAPSPSEVAEGGRAAGSDQHEKSG